MEKIDLKKNTKLWDNQENKITYFDYMCTCNKCVNRGEYEVFINDIYGEFHDCVTVTEFKQRFDIYYKTDKKSDIEYIESLIQEYLRRQNDGK